MKTTFITLAGIGLASCTAGFEIDKLDVYKAVEMGYEQVDKCLMIAMHNYMDVTLNPELLSEMAATRCMVIAQSQVGIIRYSRGDRWTKQQLAAPFLSHREIQMRAFSIFANVVRDYKSGKTGKAKP